MIEKKTENEILVGLTTSQANLLLKKYGLNSVENRSNVLLGIIKRAVITPINIMILLAGIVSLIIGNSFDSLIIFILLFLNILIVFFQEFKAEKQLSSIHSKLVTNISVLRDGSWSPIDFEKIVPSDIICLKSGDTIPADCKFVKLIHQPIIIDDSAITGESLPKELQINDLVYSSSIIRSGEGWFEVISTGKSTKFGKLASIVETEKSHGNLENIVFKVGTFLMILGGVLLVLTFVYLNFYLSQPLYYSILFSLTLLISFIPTAMPAVVSTVLLTNAYDLSKENILVKRLSSTFDLSQMQILSSDKTGTITQNKLELKSIESLNNNYDALQLALSACETNSPDPIDQAIINQANKNKVKPLKVQKYFPYDSNTKFSYAEVMIDGTIHKVCKGADYVLLKAPSEQIKSKQSELYSKGYRVIAVTVDEIPVGLISLYDPPRTDAKDFISKLVGLGIQIKMVTGDSLPVAQTIAKEVNLTGSSVTRKELNQPGGDPKLLENNSIFAQTFPEDKYKIVSSLRKNYVVGVTGDGVNDISAFKASNVSIAVYNAVNAAKNFSDLILTSPGLNQLSIAINNSRMSLKRIENFLIYRISENIRFPLFIVASLFLFKSLVLTPIMVLLLTVVNDVPIFAIATDTVTAYSNPRKINLKEIFLIASILGVLGVMSSLFFVFILLKIFNFPWVTLQILLFLELALTGHFLLFAVHARRKHWYEDLPSKTLLAATIGTQLLATIVSLLYFNIDFYLIVLIWVFSFLVFNFNDFIKTILFKEIWI